MNSYIIPYSYDNKEFRIPSQRYENNYEEQRIKKLIKLRKKELDELGTTPEGFLLAPTDREETIEKQLDREGDTMVKEYRNRRRRTLPNQIKYLEDILEDEEDRIVEQAAKISKKKKRKTKRKPKRRKTRRGRK